MENNDNKVFYNETVRNETSKSRRHDSIKKMAIVSIAASVLCGGALGLGIGVGIPLSDKVIVPMITSGNIVKPIENKPAAEEHLGGGDSKNKFKFEEPRTESLAATFGSEGFGDIIQAVEPSVVAIISDVQSANSYLFGASSQQAGSGIIFYDGEERVFITTNYHVIQNADVINVSIENTDSVIATVVGSDAQSDLAVISVSKTDLHNVGIDSVTVAVFGDSTKVRTGDFVLAIGNAFGQGNTATFGMVSAKDRALTTNDSTILVIQSDAAINSGNSGGPLINTKGEIIGINTAKQIYTDANRYGSASSVEGVGYSIASNIAKPIIESLMNQKPKPFLGIEGEDVTSETAEQLNSFEFGVIVRSVVQGASAEKAGIQRSDVITSFNGSPVFSMEMLAEAIAQCEVGDQVEIRILRNGKTLSLTVTISDYSSFGR